MPKNTESPTDILWKQIKNNLENLALVKKIVIDNPNNVNVFGQSRERIHLSLVELALQQKHIKTAIYLITSSTESTLYENISLHTLYEKLCSNDQATAQQYQYYFERIYNVLSLLELKGISLFKIFITNTIVNGSHNNKHQLLKRFLLILGYRDTNEKVAFKISYNTYNNEYLRVPKDFIAFSHFSQHVITPIDSCPEGEQESKVRDIAVAIANDDRDKLLELLPGNAEEIKALHTDFETMFTYNMFDFACYYNRPEILSDIIKNYPGSINKVSLYRKCIRIGNSRLIKQLSLHLSDSDRKELSQDSKFIYDLLLHHIFFRDGQWDTLEAVTEEIAYVDNHFSYMSSYADNFLSFITENLFFLLYRYHGNVNKLTQTLINLMLIAYNSFAHHYNSPQPTDTSSLEKKPRGDFLSSLRYAFHTSGSITSSSITSRIHSIIKETFKRSKKTIANFKTQSQFVIDATTLAYKQFTIIMDPLMRRQEEQFLKNKVAEEKEEDQQKAIFNIDYNSINVFFDIDGLVKLLYSFLELDPPFLIHDSPKSLTADYQTSLEVSGLPLRITYRPFESFSLLADDLSSPSSSSSSSSSRHHRKRPYSLSRSPSPLPKQQRRNNSSSSSIAASVASTNMPLSAVRESGHLSEGTYDLSKYLETSDPSSSSSSSSNSRKRARSPSLSLARQQRRRANPNPRDSSSSSSSVVESTLPLSESAMRKQSEAGIPSSKQEVIHDANLNVDEMDTAANDTARISPDDILALFTDVDWANFAIIAQSTEEDTNDDALMQDKSA